jgi:hypothetical protein
VSGGRVALKQFWTVLPMEARQRTLAALSRMVARHLEQPIGREEVGHDRH